jgi:CDP-glucose 4,6-dehydratase
MLKELGHEVHGYSLPPLENSLFQSANLGELCGSDIRGDIRDLSNLSTAVEGVDPDVIIHLAAQPLVRRGYLEPEETFTTNFDGTLNLLSASKELDRLTALIVVTTDKVYQNTRKTQGYVESDPLGGTDPYSASKAAADILSQSWSHAFPKAPIAIARAGNVLGARDVSEDRLIPDMLRAFKETRAAEIRNPDAVRPWQHVLDCLNGYLALVAKVQSSGVSGAWNFGPDPKSFQPVSLIADHLTRIWGEGASWCRTTEENAPHEDAHLVLNSQKSASLLGWSNKYSFQETLEEIVEIEHALLHGSNARETVQKAVQSFMTK